MSYACQLAGYIFYDTPSLVSIRAAFLSSYSGQVILWFQKRNFCHGRKALVAGVH